MELLQKLPDELQRIVVSYSRPKYPYLLEFKKQTFIDNFLIYINNISFERIKNLYWDMVKVDRMYYKLCENKNYYPWNNRIILEEYPENYLNNKPKSLSSYTIVDWMRWELRMELDDEERAWEARMEIGERDEEYSDSDDGEELIMSVIDYNNRCIFTE